MKKLLTLAFTFTIFLFIPRTTLAIDYCCTAGSYFSPITNRCEDKNYSSLISLQKICKDTEFIRSFATMNLDKALIDSCGKIDATLKTLSSSAPQCPSNQACNATTQTCADPKDVPKDYKTAKCPPGSSDPNSNISASALAIICQTGDSCINDSVLNQSLLSLATPATSGGVCGKIKSNLASRSSCEAPLTPIVVNNTVVCAQLANNMWEFNAKISPCPNVYVNDKQVNGIQTAIGCVPTDDLTAFLSFVLKWVFGLAGGIVLLMVISTGYTLLTSSGNPEKLQAVKENLVSIFSGLILIGFSLVLLQTIGADILKLPTF